MVQTNERRVSSNMYAKLGRENTWRDFVASVDVLGQVTAVNSGGDLALHTANKQQQTMGATGKRYEVWWCGGSECAERE